MEKREKNLIKLRQELNLEKSCLIQHSDEQLKAALLEYFRFF